jgi:hypothetical protein
MLVSLVAIILNTDIIYSHLFLSMIANNIFPASPLSFVLYLMVVMLRINNHLTDECAEIVMAFLNAALNLANDPYRFPKKIITLTRRDQAQKVFCNGITYYTVYVLHAIKCIYLHPPKNTAITSQKFCQIEQLLLAMKVCMKSRP